MHFLRLQLITFAAALLVPCQPSALAATGDAPAAATPADPRAVQVAGLWCGTGLLHEYRIQLSQEQHQFRGSIQRRERIWPIEGRVEGSTLRTETTKIGSLVLEVAGDALLVTGGEGPVALIRGARFQSAIGATCAG